MERPSTAVLTDAMRRQSFEASNASDHRLIEASPPTPDRPPISPVTVKRVVEAVVEPPQMEGTLT